MGNSRRDFYSRVAGHFKPRASHILLLGIALIVVIAGIRLSERLVVPEVIPPPPLLVEAVRAAPGPLVVTSSYSGSVEAEKRATLSSRLASSVVARYVKEGDIVEQGQVLMQLNNAEQQQERLRLKASADRIRADLNFWEGQLKMDRRLSRQGSISGQKLQETIRQVAALTASKEENRYALKTAETRLGYTTIAAPFAGVVQSVMVEEGETVNPGSPLLEVVDPGTLKAVISAPQSDRRRLSPGLQVYLDLHKQAEVMQGRIGHIYPALDRRNRNFSFEVPFQQGDRASVHAGMSVEAEVELMRLDSVFVVPLHAVQKREGKEGIFVVRQGLAVWQPVTTGYLQGDRVQLTDGITTGELVITTPHPALEPGRSVQVYRDEKVSQIAAPEA